MKTSDNNQKYSNLLEKNSAFCFIGRSRQSKGYQDAQVNKSEKAPDPRCRGGVECWCMLSENLWVNIIEQEKCKQNVWDRQFGSTLHGRQHNNTNTFL